MVFKQLNDGSCRTYLIASDRTREAALIDPVLQSIDDYLRLMHGQGLKLRWIIDTHTHADHVSGAAAIQRTTQAEYLMHANTAVTCISQRVQDGESLGFGEITLKFMHTPGHTQDSLTILMPDRFLSGDFLFIGQGGAGRLDLPGGDVSAHYESLKKLDSFSDETLMFPAHDYRGNAQSTLRAERASNPVLKPRSRDEYLKWWSGLRLGPADWMRDVLKANAACVCDPNAVTIPKAAGSTCEACAPAPPKAAGVGEWTAQELANRLAAGALTIVDVREPDEYTGELGHIRGSRLIPLGQIADRMEEIPQNLVVTVCRSGGRSMRAANQLAQAGWSQVYSLRGGMMGWNDAGLPVEHEAPAR